jgi:hypothetical protein
MVLSSNQKHHKCLFFMEVELKTIC